VINPTAHLHGLPVMLVNEDTGASVDGRHLDLGANVADALVVIAAELVFWGAVGLAVTRRPMP
jgi:hypothetical protein